MDKWLSCRFKSHYGQQWKTLTDHPSVNEPRHEKTNIFAYAKNKDADQLRVYREADQRLCFHYIDSIIPLLSITEISSLWSSCVALQPCLFGTWSETQKTGFLTTRLIWVSD